MKIRDLFDLVEASQYPPLTELDFQKIARLKEIGLGWSAIAQRIMRPGTEAQLRVQWHRYQTGKWHNKIQKTLDADADLEREVEAGPDLTAIARRKGVTRQALTQRAMRLGLDREMRDEISASKRIQ